MMRFKTNRTMKRIILAIITVFLFTPSPGETYGNETIPESDEKTTVQANLQEDQQVLFHAFIDRVIELKKSAGNQDELQTLLENDPLCRDANYSLDSDVNSEAIDSEACYNTPLICLNTGDCGYICLGLRGGIQSLELTTGECYTVIFCMESADCSATCYRIF